MLERCFLHESERLLRRPTLEEIEAIGAPPPHSEFGPYRDVYDRLELPLLLVWATNGLSAGRRQEIESIAAERSDRTMIAIEASHNVPMQRPLELADLTLSHFSAR